MDLEPDPREGACRSRQGIMGSGVYSMSNKWGHAQSTHEASRVDGGSWRSMYETWYVWAFVILWAYHLYMQYSILSKNWL